MNFLHIPSRLPTIVKNKTETLNGIRHYQLVTEDGNSFSYPSVTTMLKQQIVKKGIIAWRKRIGEKKAKQILTKTARKGTSFHNLAEKYLNNEKLIFETPFIQEQFESAKPEIHRISEVWEVESVLWSHKLNLAGRVDCIGKFDSIPSIVDFKTVKVYRKEEHALSYFLQECCYSLMYEELTNLIVPQIVIIVVNEYSKPQVFIKQRKDYFALLATTLKKGLII